jgi:hypothetical protein
MPKRVPRKPPEDELLEQAMMLDALARLAPIARLFGKRGRAMAKQLSDAKQIANDARHMVAARRRFTELFGGRGWIAFEMMNHDALREAVALAETVGLDDAEAFLVAHYTADVVRQHLRFMVAVEHYRPRADLLDLAADDYEQGRFHASVPVVLAQIEGLYQDVARDTFFRRTRKQGADMVAWGSISAAPGGLPDIAVLLSAPRTRTELAPIDVPYRHGILHGRDLGYGNRTVAAKAWATLFALREYLIRAERGELGPPPPKIEPTLRETFAKLAEQGRERKALDAWRPRESLVYRTFDSLPAGAPEEVAKGWLDAWIASDFDGMAAMSHPLFFDDTDGSSRANELRMAVEAFSPAAVEDLVVTDEAPSISEIVATMSDGSGLVVPITMRMFYRDNDQFLLRGSPSGRWGVGLVNLGDVQTPREQGG